MIHPMPGQIDPAASSLQGVTLRTTEPPEPSGLPLLLQGTAPCCIGSQHDLGLSPWPHPAGPGGFPSQGKLSERCAPNSPWRSSSVLHDRQPR